MEPEYFESLYPQTSREAEITQLVTAIKEGNSCQVLGLPGMGRSTLLSLLAHNKAVRMHYFGKTEKTIHFVLVNFSEIRNRPLFDVMKFLFLNLTETLRERKMTEEHKVVGDIFREHLSFQDELILFQGFKEAIDYLTLQKKINVVFLFDRFEEYIPTVTSEFFTNLRTLRNRAKYRFSVVFSLYRPLEAVVEPSLLADYYEFVAGHLIFLRLYDEVMATFRVSYIEKITSKKIPPSVLEEIIVCTGGLSKLVKLSVESVLAHGEPIEKLSEFLLTQKTIISALREIWFSLTPAEQADIRQNNFSDKSVDQYLEQVGLLKENVLQIPLFVRFVETVFGDSLQEKTAIVYDENTNAIRKGEDLLSDQLTASEFRLLRYLLQRQEQVVERDELIDVVWQGMKSTAGITDQAVDQLVFRLRRKIEEDANHPVHLQTVKGRGFRFVA